MAGLTMIFLLFHPLSISAWADGKSAELAEQVGEMVEYHEFMNQNKPNRDLLGHPV